MKVLFLDIDGVLNSWTDWVEKKEFGHPHNEGSTQINRSQLALISRVVRETECKIVISSTWRHYFSLDKIHKFFVERGWPHPREVIVGETPSKLSNNHRGQEIEWWLEENSCDRYCIVDDDASMFEEQLPYFVNTDGDIGLTYKQHLKIIENLNKKSDS